MFSRENLYNQDIGDWDVSSVNDMSGMFKSAESFDQEISDWVVSNVIGIRSMFRGAESFDQNISDLRALKIPNTNYFALAK